MFPLATLKPRRPLIFRKLSTPWARAIRRLARGSRFQGENLLIHVGCGRELFKGWVNIDLQPLPGVDVVADVTQGMEFDNVRAVYAEHLLEHLELDGAIRFLLEVNRALGTEGWFRLSTPNLDWVWATHYRLDTAGVEKHHMTLRLNRAFHGWQHRFLWNREFLVLALEACGFVEIRSCPYGESNLEVFQGVERHETYEDSSELPHVIIVEAKKGPAQPHRLEELRGLVQREFLDHLGM